MSSRIEDSLSGFATVVGFIGAGAITIWSLWCTWIGFVGGQYPIPFMDWWTRGSFIEGILWLIVGTPILAGIANAALSFLLLLILSPLFLKKTD